MKTSEFGLKKRLHSAQYTHVCFSLGGGKAHDLAVTVG